MANTTFTCKEFVIHQDQCAMKVTTDACLFGAWTCQETTDIHQDPLKILDIGAGTGLLTLMLAQQFSNAHFTGVELDASAAQQAAINCAQSPWNERITIEQGDILQFSSPSLFDLIISNPPFYESDLKSSSSKKNWAFHDHGIKLGQLLIRINELLAPGGLFFVLLPPRREADFFHWCNYTQLQLLHSCTVQPTSEKPISRVFYQGCKSNPSALPPTNSTLTVQGNISGYSRATFQLLSPYYLSL